MGTAIPVTMTMTIGLAATATAVLGVLLAEAVLATAGRTGQPGEDAGNPFAVGGRLIP